MVDANFGYNLGFLDHGNSYFQVILARQGDPITAEQDTQKKLPNLSWEHDCAIVTKIATVKFSNESL